MQKSYLRLPMKIMSIDKFPLKQLLFFEICARETYENLFTSI